MDLASAAGVRWEFLPEGATTWVPIQVPAGGWKTQGLKTDAGEYRAKLSAPSVPDGSRLRLEFDAVNFGARVLAGPDEAKLLEVASHVNGWMPFAADITERVAESGEVVVRVAVSGREKFKVNGKYIVPEGATWFPGLADGILRGVRLRVVPALRIEDVWIRTTLSPDTLRTRVTIVNDGDEAAAVTLRARLDRENGPRRDYPSLPESATTVPAHGRVELDLAETPWTLGPDSHWWPNVPYREGYRARLHRLALELATEGRIVHSFDRRFGFREFRVSGNKYLLNGVRCNLRGDNQQEANFGPDAYGTKPGFGPPGASNPGWPHAVDNLLRLNFNVLRIHQIPGTPYMLDVCDELGLLVVGETPLRGSEGGEDFVAGRTHMLDMVRELVLRDRHHPSIVLWSPANEWGEPIRPAMAVIKPLDDTRPIIADGIGDIGPDVINMEHYVGGIGTLPLIGGTPRGDRPYGETESIWFNDNSPRGFAWFATSTRVRRLKGNADIRNYVLNNVWPNYVAGESDQTQVLESAIKDYGHGPRRILPPIEQPWAHPNIRLMQDFFHPLTACDIEFDLANARSNARGEWPVFRPRLAPDTEVRRRVAVFNDEFFGDRLELRWEVRRGGPTGKVLAKGREPLTIPPGEFATRELTFKTPADGSVSLVLTVRKDGKRRFREERIAFRVSADTDPVLARPGDYRIVGVFNGLALSLPSKPAADVVQLPAAEATVWTLQSAGHNTFRITERGTGLALAAVPLKDKPEAALVVQPATDSPLQLWRVGEDPEGAITLKNVGDGRLVDVANNSRKAGTQLWLWTAHRGDNQLWELRPEPEAP